MVSSRIEILKLLVSGKRENITTFGNSFFEKPKEANPNRIVKAT